MNNSRSASSALVRHGPAHGAIHSIEADAQISTAGIGLFRFVLRADLATIRIPLEQPPERADELWRHTCFEAFIRTVGVNGYYEANFSPSRQWALYHFDAYREGMRPVELDAPPQISVRRFDGRLELDAALQWQKSSGPRNGCLQVGLCAVTEEDDGTLGYWALQHAAGRPDFHRAEGFTLGFEVDQ